MLVRKNIYYFALYRRIKPIILGITIINDIDIIWKELLKHPYIKGKMEVINIDINIIKNKIFLNLDINYITLQVLWEKS